MQGSTLKYEIKFSKTHHYKHSVWSNWLKDILFVTEYDKGLGRAKMLCLALSKTHTHTHMHI